MKPRPLMKARDIAEEFYKDSPRARAQAEALMRGLGREGKLVRNRVVRGVWARREDVEESFEADRLHD